MDFGDKLKQIIRERGITQDELADRAGIKRSRLSNYISQGTQPSTKALLGIARALNMMVEELVANTEYGVG